MSSSGGVSSSPTMTTSTMARRWRARASTCMTTWPTCLPNPNPNPNPNPYPNPNPNPNPNPPNPNPSHSLGGAHAQILRGAAEPARAPSLRGRRATARAPERVRACVLGRVCTLLVVQLSLYSSVCSRCYPLWLCFSKVRTCRLRTCRQQAHYLLRFACTSLRYFQLR